ncbi:hypothetical protein [Paenibacillus sp. FSL H7-689]|uniref:hypothetical protein n=1 Tax=Paenibacillus sp. FSL H7-689 TaxID=1227349 RepID=UPI0003E2BBBF|nr:hypothetical protein [Paenibacillus sp. FSL H7-689]ETT44842.1 hypothetical protein C170_23110 [Paenibacillus sp. FSL H7-689]
MYNRKLLRQDSHFYFDCMKTKTYHYFQHIGAPIDWLLYNSYESTRSIKEQIVMNRNHNWAYLTSCLEPEDLDFVGGKQESIIINNFQNAMEHIKKKSEERKVLVFKCDEYHIPHREWTYLQRHAYHYMYIIGYDDSGGSTTLQMIDDGYPDFNYVNYDVAIFNEMYEKEIIEYFFDSALIDPQLSEQIGWKYREYISGLDDDFSLFDDAIVFMETNDYESMIANRGLYFLEHAFSKLSASRIIFTRFLTLLDAKLYSEIIKKLIDCSKALDMLQHLMKKHSLLNEKNDAEEIISLCRKIKKMEIEQLDKLKTFV